VEDSNRSQQSSRRMAGPAMSDTERRDRVRGQVEIVRDALGADEVEHDTEEPADFRYLYRSGALLVRDRDLDRVRSVVNGEVRDSLIGGLTLFQPSGRGTQNALAEIDAALGRGIATPDHVVYVTPAGGCCPATEPEVPGTFDPHPSLSSADPSDGEDVLVSVVDTGWLPEAAVNPRTPWLQDVTGDQESYDPESIRPYAGHGTFVAGVVRCLAPSAQVRVEGFLINGGAVFESELIKQLDDALIDAPDVITMSAGTTTRNNQDLLAFQVFWETRLSRLKGTVLVTAAGNDGGRGPFWPAAFPWTVSVGALNGDNERAPFSNYGSWVDVFAPGTDLVNAYATGTYVTQEPPVVGERRVFEGIARWSGTSFATPVVAGLIAARMSKTGENARQAADALMAIARTHTKTGVGARLTPEIVGQQSFSNGPGTALND
jgi:subtilisin family serine protease